MSSHHLVFVAIAHPRIPDIIETMNLQERLITIVRRTLDVLSNLPLALSSDNVFTEKCLPNPITKDTGLADREPT